MFYTYHSYVKQNETAMFELSNNRSVWLVDFNIYQFNRGLIANVALSVYSYPLTSPEPLYSKIEGV